MSISLVNTTQKINNLVPPNVQDMARALEQLNVLV